MVSKVLSAAGSSLSIIEYSSIGLKFVIGYFTVFFPILLYLYLRRNPVTIYCPGCIEDGQIYKCSKGSGKHSTACDVYKKTTKALVKGFNAIKSAFSVIVSIPKKFFAIIVLVKNGVGKLVNMIQKLNPFTKLRGLLRIKVNMGGCKICTSDIHSILKGPCVDPCAGLSKAVNKGVLGPINGALDGVTDVIEGLVGTLTDLVKSMVVTPIVKVVKEIIKALMQPVIAIKNELLGLLKEVAGFIKLIVVSGLEILFAFFTMWNHAFVNKIIRKLGFPKFFELSALTALILTLSILAIPIIGGYIGVIKMITDNVGKATSTVYDIFETIITMDKRILAAVALVIIIYLYVSRKNKDDQKKLK